MAVKTITIDMEAYKRLKTAKRVSESFSQAIKRLVPKPFDLDAWLRETRHHRLSPKVAAAIEEQVGLRRRSSHLER